jgi:hypothetical protein
VIDVLESELLKWRNDYAQAFPHTVSTLDLLVDRLSTNVSPAENAIVSQHWPTSAMTHGTRHVEIRIRSESCSYQQLAASDPAFARVRNALSLLTSSELLSKSSPCQETATCARPEAFLGSHRSLMHNSIIPSDRDSFFDFQNQSDH